MAKINRSDIPRPIKNPLVYVEFDDHSAGNEWSDSGDHVQEIPCIAIGWVTKETKKSDTLSSFIDISNKPFGSSSRANILKSTITKRRRLT